MNPNRMPSVGVAGQVGRFRPEQIVQINTWSGIRDPLAAALHYIHVAPLGSTTITRVNPLDPGDDADDYVRDIDCTDPSDFKVWPLRG